MKLMLQNQSVQKRFGNIKIIPGTRSFHEFIPITPNEMRVSFCSENQDICQTHNFKRKSLD